MQIITFKKKYYFRQFISTSYDNLTMLKEMLKNAKDPSVLKISIN